MNEKEFVALCKKVVAGYANAHFDKTEAMVSTTLFDGMYYELTYNGNKKELYVDAYKKWDNVCVSVE